MRNDVYVLRNNVYVLTPKAIRKVHSHLAVLTQRPNYWRCNSLINCGAKRSCWFLGRIKRFRIKCIEHIGRYNWHRVFIQFIIFIYINLALVKVKTLDNALVQVNGFVLSRGLLRRDDLEGVLYHAHAHFSVILMWVIYCYVFMWV